MKDFDIAKYLREHQLGSYGILNHYVDIKPLKEEEKTEVEMNAEIPYEGPEHKLTGNGEGDEFEHAETVSEIEAGGEPDYANVMELGGEQIEQGIISLTDEGFSKGDILELCKEFILAHAHAKSSGMQFEETLSEGDIDRLAGLINRQDLAAMQTAVQNIFDDLTDDGFAAEDVERYLVNYVRKAAVPYLLK